MFLQKLLGQATPPRPGSACFFFGQNAGPCATRQARLGLCRDVGRPPQPRGDLRMPPQPGRASGPLPSAPDWPHAPARAARLACKHTTHRNHSDTCRRGGAPCHRPGAGSADRLGSALPAPGRPTGPRNIRSGGRSRVGPDGLGVGA